MRFAWEPSGNQVFAFRVQRILEFFLLPMNKRFLLIPIPIAFIVYAWLLYPFSFLTARDAIGAENIATLNDRQVAYYVSGQGPRIVLAASLAREASDFNELVQDLNRVGYRTVCVEAPGIGATSEIEKPTSLYTIAGDINAAIDRDIKETGNTSTVALIGHAFGNRVMRATAAKYPGIARSVILIAAGGQRPIAERAKTELRNSILPYLPAARRKQAIDYAFFADGNEIPAYWLRGWHLRTALLQASTLEHTEDERWQDAGGLPILIVQALEDTIAPKADTADLLKARFGARLDVFLVEKAGHALLPERPEIVSRAIIDYLGALK